SRPCERLERPAPDALVSVDRAHRRPHQGCQENPQPTRTCFGGFGAGHIYLLHRLRDTRDHEADRIARPGR
ncbi:hypothetical protein ABTE76_19550, partial [Acinetobacter baumannii]